MSFSGGQFGIIYQKTLNLHAFWPQNYAYRNLALENDAYVNVYKKSFIAVLFIIAKNK